MKSFLSRYACSPSLSTVLKSLVERATARVLKVLSTITNHDAVVRDKNPDCSKQSLDSVVMFRTPCISDEQNK